MKSVCFLCPFIHSTVTHFLQAGFPRTANVTGSPSLTLCVLVKPKLKCQANLPVITFFLEFLSGSETFSVFLLPLCPFFGWPVQILATVSEI